ncbi:MAG: SDR family NAD(P)-dependent oxidoreductase, partial [bacterium]|nr:SDR family NAD(P)-dependent oxidoreductase [bacterium]
REVQQIESASRLYRADVSRPEEAKNVIQSLVRDFGRIDILVNNAGPMLMKPLEETSPEEWDGMIRSNLSSAFYCSKYALEIMREQGEGQILNIGCLHGEVGPGGLPNSPAYGIAKSGVLMLTRMLARSEAKNNIRVNAINPGLIETDDYGTYSQEERRRWLARVPLGKFGQPDDIAEAALFLTSDRAAYITGTVLPVHGGLWLPGP